MDNLKRMTASKTESFYRLINTRWGHFGMVMSAPGSLVATFLPLPEQEARRMIAERFPYASQNNKLAETFSNQVGCYFSGRKVSWKVEIDWSDWHGFRRRVLEACHRIPFGCTASYADLARAAGSPGAARAVGSAMAANPLPLIIPCHRVLCSDGSLGGYSSPQGPSQKRRLLELENPDFGLMTVPRTALRTSIAQASQNSRSRSRLTHSA